MRYTAWIALAPDQLHGCALADISDTGGRINVESSDAIPGTFTLWLASNGSAQRQCRVVWRQPRQIGVAFDRPVFNAEQASLVPKLSLGRKCKAIGTDEVTHTVNVETEPAKPV